MLKAVIFDMDDTLLDWSNQDIDWAAFHAQHTSYVLDYVQSTVPNVIDSVDVDDVCSVMLNLTRAAWKTARETLRAPHIGAILMDTFQEFGVPADALRLDDLVNAYQWKPQAGVRPFADVPAALQLLRDNNIKIGLITNAFQPMHTRIQELAAFDLDGYFEPDAMFSAADVGFLKPHPKIFAIALEALDVAPDEAVFVGDSREADILGAKNAGMRGVLRIRLDSTAVLRNQITPDGEIYSLEDLFPMLDQWYPGWRG